MTDFKSEKGVRAQANSVFEQNVNIQGDLNVDQDIVVTGNLTVSGTADFTIDTSALNDVIPAVTGNDLGTASLRWDGFFTNVSTNGYMRPSANGVDLGSTTLRWDGWFVTLDTSGDATIGGNLSVIGDLDVSGNATLNNFSVSSLVTTNASVIGNSASVTTTGSTVIDSFPKAQAKQWKYIIGMTTNLATSVFVMEIICAHNDTTVYTSQYGEINISSSVTLSVDISGSDMQLSATCPSASGPNTHVFNILRLELSS